MRVRVPGSKQYKCRNAIKRKQKSNADEICKIFNIPVNIIKGTASSQEYTNAFKMGVMPVLRVIECALNRELLLEKKRVLLFCI